MHQHCVSTGGAFPIVAGVHRKETAAQCRDAADPNVGQLDLKGLDIDIGRPLRHIQPVEYAVDENVSKAVLLRLPHKCEQAVGRRVNLAVAYEPDKVNLRACSGSLLERCVQHFIRQRRTIWHCEPAKLRSADTARSDGQVAEFCVAPVAGLLSDLHSRRGECGHRKFTADGIIIRRMSHCDGIAVRAVHSPIHQG